MIRRAGLARLLAAGAILLAGGCRAPTYREVERIRSPDGRWDAVVAFPLWGEYRGRTAVVVTRADAGTRGRYPQFVADCLRALTVRWRGPGAVAIGVEKARIWEYDDVAWFFDAGRSETVAVRLETRAERLLGGCADSLGSGALPSGFRAGRPGPRADGLRSRDLARRASVHRSGSDPTSGRPMTSRDTHG